MFPGESVHKVKINHPTLCTVHMYVGSSSRAWNYFTSFLPYSKKVKSWEISVLLSMCPDFAAGTSSLYFFNRLAWFIREGIYF